MQQVPSGPLSPSTGSRRTAIPSLFTKLKSAVLGASISKSQQSQSQESARDKRREENKSFLNVFVLQKTGVVIFFELVLQMFDAMNDLNLEETASAENIRLTARREGTGAC